jgi:predicted metalloprotease
MILGIFAFVGYGICKAMNKDDIGKAIVVIAIFGALSNIMQAVMPIIQKEEENSSKFRYEKYKDYITDKANDATDNVKEKTKFNEKEEDDLWNKVLNKIKGEGD